MGNDAIAGELNDEDGTDPEEARETTNEIIRTMTGK